MAFLIYLAGSFQNVSSVIFASNAIAHKICGLEFVANANIARYDQKSVNWALFLIGAVLIM